METVTITKAEYDQLRRRDCLMTAYEDAGVDNWSGQEFVYDTYRELLEEAGLSDDD